VNSTWPTSASGPDWNPLGYDTPPRYCHQCGKPYPWTETAIHEAIRLAADEAAWSAEDQEAFNEAVPELCKSGPKTDRAVATVLRLMDKAGEYTVNTFKRVMVAFAAEAVKQQIWPGT